MFKNKTFLGIIPARGGSKRLKNKNILKLNGKPLIAWSIEAGFKSSYIDEVMVTTDDDKIITIAKDYGAKVPFKRPKKLSDNGATTSDVVRHAIDFYSRKLHKVFDYLVILQPTSPLRDGKDIDNAIRLIFKKNADAVISICQLDHPIEWTERLPKNKSMFKFFNKKNFKFRSQNLPKYYRLNGAIYICNVKKFLKEGSVFLKKNIYGFEMPQEKSIDIDTKTDFKLANALIK
jgi:CMP-N,N'-diacetyllegionaminic acid synthase